MGTRSTVKFYDEEECVASIYQQYDGYLKGVGLSLAKFLKSKIIINGFSEQTMETHANGIGCLASQYIAKIKTKIGNVYMTTKDDEEEYNYKVYCNASDELKITVEDFTGNVEKFYEYCNKTIS